MKFEKILVLWTSKFPINHLGGYLFSACALAALAVELATAGQQDSVRSASGSQVVRTDSEGSLSGGELVTRPARAPLFVNVRLGLERADPVLDAREISSIRKMIGANPDRLITLNLVGASLSFGGLSDSARELLLTRRGSGVVNKYNAFMAARVRSVLDQVMAIEPCTPLSVYGLPFAGRSDEARKANAAYRGVIDCFNAFVVNVGILSGPPRVELAEVVRLCPEAFCGTKKKAVIFRASGEWRVAFEGNIELAIERDVQVTTLSEDAIFGSVVDSQYNLSEKYSSVGSGQDGIPSNSRTLSRHGGSLPSFKAGGGLGGGRGFTLGLGGTQGSQAIEVDTESSVPGVNTNYLGAEGAMNSSSDSPSGGSSGAPLGGLDYTDSGSGYSSGIGGDGSSGAGESGSSQSSLVTLELTADLPREWAPFSFVSEGGAIPDHCGSPEDRMYNEQVIARFISPLFSEFGHEDTLSVFAYAGGYIGDNVRNRVDRVEFFANGGGIAIATEPVEDENGNVVFSCLLPSQWNGNVAEIRAVVYPTVGRPRILQGPWFESGYIATLAEDEYVVNKRFADRGVFVCRWEDVWFVDQWNGKPSATGRSASDPVSSVAHIALPEGNAAGLKIHLLGSNESRRYRVNSELLPPIGPVSPTAGLLPLHITGGVFEISSNENSPSDIGSLILSDCTIRQDCDAPGRFVLKNRDFTAYFQLQRFSAGYASENEVFQAAESASSNDAEFLPINNTGGIVKYITSIFEFSADMADFPFHQEAVNGTLSRPLSDSCNARGLAVNLRHKNVGKWIYPLGSVNAYGDGSPSVTEVELAWESGQPLDLGAWPDSEQQPAHYDILQIENSRLSNCVVYRVDVTQDLPGLTSTQALFLSRNNVDGDVLFDVVLKDCSIWNRDESTSQYSLSLGPWASDRGEGVSHNIHVDNVLGVSARVIDPNDWTAINSFWIGGLRLSAATGLVADDVFYAGMDRAESRVRSIPDNISGGFTFVPGLGGSLWAELPIDFNGFF